MPFLKRKFTSRRTLRPVTGKFLDRTGKTVFKSLTKNHQFNAALYLSPPTPGLLGAIGYAIKWFLLSVGIPLLRMALLIVLYVIWIPSFIYAVIWFLRQ
jgi:hypothetical protein